MFSFKPIYFVIFALILFEIQAEISDKRLCIDVNCSELISIGKTLLRYASPEKNVLSFVPNENVKVYSHGAGTRPELIGVEINGLRGYINKNHFRETNLIKRPTLLVDTEIVKNKPEVPLTEIKADPTQEPYQVVDGTRIPLDLDSFSTEAPAVNVVSQQSSEQTTKPLDSVPENQNGNPTVPGEPNIIDIDENKDTGDQQHQNELDNNDNEDSDDEDDDDSDDGDVENEETDENDEEIESENKYKETSNSDSTKNVVGQNPTEANGQNSKVINNATEETSKSTEAIILEKENIVGNVLSNEIPVVRNDAHESNRSVINNAAEEKYATVEAADIKNVVSGESSQNNELNSNISDKLKTEQIQISIENVTEGSENSKPETFQKEPDVGKTNIGGSLPIGKISAIEKPEVEKVAIKDFKKPSYENILEKLGTNNAESTDKLKDELDSKLDETKEQKPSEETRALPISVTENPVDIEAIPPVNIDLVTPDPVNNQIDISSVNEDSENETEVVSSPSDSVPRNFEPIFKDPEEGAEIKVEEKVGGGFFGGGGMLSIFNTGDDREVSESSVATSEVKQVPEESEQNNEPEVVESDFPVPAKQDDLPQIENSEDLLQNSDAIVSENVSVTKQDGLSQNVNSEAPERHNFEETEGPNMERTSDSQEETSGGFLANVISFFSGNKDGSAKNDGENKEIVKENFPYGNNFEAEAQELNENKDTNTNSHSPWSLNNRPEQNGDVNKQFCDKNNQNCPNHENEVVEPRQEELSISGGDLQILFVEAFRSDLFLYLTTTALSVLFLVFGMVILDKCRREGPLIARINKLEKQLLTTLKENEILQEKSMSCVEEKTQLVVETVPNGMVEELNKKLAEMNGIKLALEDQIQALEKELDTSTEVGIELNKIISEMLSSSDGSEIIKENIEQMQKKLLEQQETINTVNRTLGLKETENHELRLEMEISNRRVVDLQSELDRLVEKLVKIEEERDQQHSTLENEILVYQTKCKEALAKEHALHIEVQAVKQQVAKLQRVADVKVKEYNTLKESLNEIKAMKNNKDALRSLLEVSEIKAQMEQFRSENLKYSEQLQQEREANTAYGTKIESLMLESKDLREKYEKADKEKVEINTKLQVLNNYFKEKEEQMQKEISKYESLWGAKEGEATSTTERIRHMQEELQNYKAQNESLKQEIVNQEVELKSQISMLEKKAHESWVATRQTERKLEEARQEAAQLRNRLTLRERAIVEGNNQARMQSPLHQNGELPISPPPIDSTQSPPPLFNPRDHLAKSPPIPGMPPPPFLPPHLGTAPFIPPPPLDGMMPPLGDMGGMPPPFMPPLPPGMFPGDHRPPPLGRMSSPPPVGGRYTPESTAYSDYERYSRRSPSPPYDSEYGASPPPIRGYSPYQDRLRDDRREYKRPQARSNGRNSKGVHSSGSENDSLGKINKKPQRKV